MSVSAVIRFTQVGATSPVDGQSVIGVVGNAVTCTSAAYGAAPSGFEWSMLDVPTGSTVSTGLFATATAVAQFTPDVTGGYMVELKVFDSDGGSATQRLAFLVPESSGRIIPPFLGDPTSLNHAGSKKGWAPYLTEYLKAVDAGGGGGSGIPATTTPVNVDLLGGVGTSTDYARADHMHGLDVTLLQALVPQATSEWDFNGNELKFLAAPTHPQSAVRKTELDALALSTSLHPPCRMVEKFSDVTLSGTQTIDSVVGTVGTRTLLTAQTNPLENGPWVQAAGAWTRPDDWQPGRILNGDFMIVTEGFNFADHIAIVTTDANPVVGTDFVQFGVYNLGPATLSGDVFGTVNNNQVWSASGDSMSHQFTMKASTVRDTSDYPSGSDKTVRASVVTTSTTPTTVLTSYFTGSFGGVTAELQVDVCDSAGNVESFKYRETRAYQFSLGPTLIAAATPILAPASPTHTVSLVWSAGNVAVEVTAASAVDTRFACKLHTYEVSQP